ncbi:hypothetical protein ES754_05295 [Psychrobacter frigidicola]|uniref:Uncharacterized protein n=1 Tax=Psychrobacter frigidicola TaxID=45611 RepID=A0A5C7A4I9_9GAMM|nr:hypothetical protein [Psychrobacter frigidicola]TXD98341.1 hypothetical protein ES754_05295 [Psychrobacter frigidicola]
MHKFSELIEMSTLLTINSMERSYELISKELETSGSTLWVKFLQTLTLQKTIYIIGVFSFSESTLQTLLICKNGFIQAEKELKEMGETELVSKFEIYRAAINVLKHGYGRSYDYLIKNKHNLSFKVKGENEGFFEEGDVSEIVTLIEVDDQFVLDCTETIKQVFKKLGF